MPEGSRERAVPHGSGLRNYIKEETLAIHRDRDTNGTKLARISQLSKENPDMVFTSLGHLINKEMLKSCHVQMDGMKAVGIDGITKEEYGRNLEENINALMKSISDGGSYEIVTAWSITLMKSLTMNSNKKSGVGKFRHRSTFSAI